MAIKKTLATGQISYKISHYTETIECFILALLDNINNCCSVMDLPIKELLHPRVLMHCKMLFNDGYYKHAALEAMTQVELALKEKSGEESKYGVNLISSLFGEKAKIKLRVPFGADLQKHAHVWFKGAFLYYRNYAAHDGSKIDKYSCMRIMITASELLELIGASSKSFTDIGGVSGLIQEGIFEDKDNLKQLLEYLDEYYLLDHVCDGFYEELAHIGFGKDEVTAVIDIGLVEYKSQNYIPTEFDMQNNFDCPDEIGWFKLTIIGKEILKS